MDMELDGVCWNRAGGARVRDRLGGAYERDLWADQGDECGRVGGVCFGAGKIALGTMNAVLVRDGPGFCA
jgi:hypothetical protein